jgi:transposase, IS30 family
LLEEKLRLDWSPEQISNWMKKNANSQICHEHINKHINSDKRFGGDLYIHLRCQKKRRKRQGSHDHRGKIRNQVSIEQRPEIVGQHLRLGDWEVDLVIGKVHSGGIVTLTDRKSHFTLLRKVASKAAEVVAQAMIALLNWVGHLETITSDRGKEFTLPEFIAEKLRLDFYFVHPYASWERGTNKNMNGLIRQYLPKNRDLSTLTTHEEFFIMDRLNL